MVQVHVGHHQRLEVINRKVDGGDRLSVTGSGRDESFREIVSLKQPAIDEQGVRRGESQFVAGSGDAVQAAVVDYPWVGVAH